MSNQGPSPELLSLKGHQFSGSNEGEMQCVKKWPLRHTVKSVGSEVNGGEDVQQETW